MSQFFVSGGQRIGASASILYGTNILGTGYTAIMEKEITTHSSILAWEFHGHRSLVGYSPWDRRVRHDLATKQQQQYTAINKATEVPA